MSVGATIVYRHKKFDQGKRSREEDSFSLGNETRSYILDLSNSHRESTPKKPRIEEITKSLPLEESHREMQQRMQLLNVHQEIPSSTGTFPLTRYEGKAPKTIKAELIELDGNVSSESSPPRQVKRSNLKTPGSQSVASMKPELIEPKKDLPTCPGAFHKSIFRFPSNVHQNITLEQDRVAKAIKAEIIELSGTIPNESFSSRQLKRSKSQTPIKTKSESCSDVYIKPELVELNKNLPLIPKETFESICRFRGNMVRKFPKKERTVKEQERRDKNTYACRKSRRVKKIEHVAIEEEYKKFKDDNMKLADLVVRTGTYFERLMRMTAEASATTHSEPEVIVVD